MMSCIKGPVVTWWLVVGEEEEFSSPVIRPQSFSEPVPPELEISQVLLRVVFFSFLIPLGCVGWLERAEVGYFSSQLVRLIKVPRGGTLIK